VPDDVGGRDRPTPGAAAGEMAHGVLQRPLRQCHRLHPDERAGDGERLLGARDPVAGKDRVPRDRAAVELQRAEAEVPQPGRGQGRAAHPRAVEVDDDPHRRAVDPAGQHDGDVRDERVHHPGLGAEQEKPPRGLPQLGADVGDLRPAVRLGDRDEPDRPAGEQRRQPALARLRRARGEQRPLHAVVGQERRDPADALDQRAERGVRSAGAAGADRDRRAQVARVRQAGEDGQQLVPGQRRVHPLRQQGGGRPGPECDQRRVAPAHREAGKPRCTAATASASRSWSCGPRTGRLNSTPEQTPA
jgi:hypothetical protein